MSKWFFPPNMPEWWFWTSASLPALILLAILAFIKFGRR